MKVKFLILLLISTKLEAQNFSKYVNPFIGTGGHGHTYPGASLPFGFCQLSPDTRIDGSWDGCSGYHYSDSLIYGFSHTHLSGTGCSDYGDILLMPTSKEVSMEDYNYSSTFSHKNETAGAGYYNVFLDKWKVDVNLTCTKRVGIHKYTFPKDLDACVVLDLKHRDEVLDSRLEIINDSTLRGHRYSKAWAANQRIYFYIQFSRPFNEVRYANDFGAKSQTGQVILEKQQHVLFKFSNTEKPLMVKVGISGVDEEGAQRNLETEASHWQFDKYKKNAIDQWDKELSKITVEGNTEEKKTIFYTALYHCLLSPNIYSDVDHRYLGRDDKIHSTEGLFDYYTVFSLWDTYRALHPLLTILDHKRTNDFIQTFIKQYEQGGRLPVWELSSNETNCMIGYHAVSVILDAYQKGIRNYPKDKAFKAMRSAANTEKFGINKFHKNGYLSIEDESESVSKTLEYAYNDWCIAEMAKQLGYKKDHQTFQQYSLSWLHVFDAKTGFMRPRSNGGWLEPFDPYQVNNNYTEANSWQYSFAPTHQLDIFNEKANLPKRLDAIFSASTKTTGREQSDISGLIGQYAHGNEPSHHIAHLYNYSPNHSSIDQIKGVRLTQQIMNTMYKNEPDGLIGNEDCGQMSAWFVFSALGLYPVCPGKPSYTFSLPLFKRIEVKGDQNFVIENRTQSSEKEIQVMLESNVKSLNKLKQPNLSSIFHQQLSNKNTIIFENKPIEKSKHESVAKKTNHTHPLFDQFVGTPIIQADQMIFTDSLEIRFETAPPQLDIRYSLDGSMPTYHSTLYQKPFIIKSNKNIKAKYFTKNTKAEMAFISEAFFYKRPNKYKINLISTYNPQYTAGGDDGLLDGLCGDTDWRKGRWQGFQSQDFEAIISLHATQHIQSIKANFLQDQKSWIFYPTEVSFYKSDDGKNWEIIERIAVNKTERADETNTTIPIQTSKPTDTKYIKVIAKNYGQLPSWHPGAGGDAFIFIDEIEIKE